MADDDAPLRVAVAQLHAATNDVAATLARIAAVVAALRGSADLLALPETFLPGGYHIGPAALRAGAVVAPSPAEVADALRGDGTGVTAPLLLLARLAASARMALVVPAAERGADGAVYNTSFLLDADGTLRAAYRKTHLWTYGGYEAEAFSPGPGAGAGAGEGAGAGVAGGDPFRPVCLAAFPRTPLGLLVCFDLEFPEACRLLAARGAAVVVAVMASGEAGGFTSMAVAPVRAMENGVAVVYANYPSSPPPPAAAPAAAGCVGALAPRYSGGSAVFGPDGVPLHALRVYAGAGGEAGGAHRATSAALDAGASAAATAAAAAAAPGGVPAADEAVFVVAVRPRAPEYAAQRARNPYLAARRGDLYGELVV
jgi:predicted amidohydrolase